MWHNLVISDGRADFKMCLKVMKHIHATLIRFMHCFELMQYTFCSESVRPDLIFIYIFLCVKFVSIVYF